jgi:hypothetical protein
VVLGGCEGGLAAECVVHLVVPVFEFAPSGTAGDFVGGGTAWGLGEVREIQGADQGCVLRVVSYGIGELRLY